MEKEFSDDTLLARWLEGRLSKNEEQELFQHPDFAIYQKIAETSKEVNTPSLNEEKVWTALSEKRSAKPKRMRIPLWLSAAAATIAIVLIANFWGESNDWSSVGVKWTTGAKVFKELQLPDASTINMNAASYIAYDEATWEKNRTVTLEGEAFFEVQKGSTFTVKSPSGSVKVLGTSFNVRDREQKFSVSCYEGRVEVNHNRKVHILEAGESIMFNENGQFEKLKIAEEMRAKLWLEGKTHYENMPLSEVLEELERQYNIEVNNELKEDPKLTSTFPHDNLETALKVIIGPKDIKYEIEEDGKKVRIFN